MIVVVAGITVSRPCDNGGVGRSRSIPLCSRAIVIKVEVDALLHYIGHVRTSMSICSHVTFCAILKWKNKLTK